MNFITGEVTTNLDKFKKEIWPTQFVEVPKINSYIESKSKITLQVVNIIHCKPSLLKNSEPYVKIEVC